VTFYVFWVADHIFSSTAGKYRTVRTKMQWNCYIPKWRN